MEKWCICLILVLISKVRSDPRPNIVFIIADDLGWNDVSFHGSDQIQTPNIDALAYSGVILNQYRTHCQCTPSRAALLTGKFAHRLGMQGYPLTNAEDRGLPITEKILPQYLKELNYSTHLVGKWHLGHSRSIYLPNKRGFDTYFGHRGGFLDYYEYTAEETWTTGKVSGLDLFRNDAAAWDVEGYITDVYTAEAKNIILSHDTTKPLFLQLSHTAPHSANEGSMLQAPSEVVRSMRHVESPERRIYAAMLKKLDDSVGEIMNTLYEKNLLKNTIIMFSSDNGGMTSGNSMNWASNWPLRGIKMSPWDGGIRSVALLWTLGLNNPDHIWYGRMHIVDWLPTILSAIGAEIPKDIDGIDMWRSIVEDKESERKEIFEIDDYTGYSAMISGKYKLITGNVSVENSYYYGGDLKGIIGKAPEYSQAFKNSKTYEVLNKLGIQNDTSMSENRNKFKIDCGSSDVDKCYPKADKHCLYNIDEDPCELVDISPIHTDIVKEMLARMQTEWDKRLPRQIPLFRNPRGKPSLHNFTWISWHDAYICSNVDDTMTT